ncbi:hypothetical protein PIROE2DRAFT_16568 [Piromyces sp. E2]|nr:hypothetical protein PIROE2DRAFT_16568 [Piromyces sp. E2]|eukprot:OUM58225.1 hypothetical protein PIROE2DRAFT_16568 [Piromyces sp. E2]
MTAERDGYSSTIDVIYAPHFVDLKEVIGEEYINSFSYDAYQTSTYEDRWISVPIFMKYKVLYSNTMYLEKYGKEVPQTWDELIETAEYIISKERENNNNDLIGYNGFFPKTKESAFPEFNSQTAINALNELKEIKNKISNAFQMDEFLNINLLYMGNILFSNYWDGIPVSLYKESILPVNASIEILKFFTSEEEQKKLARIFWVKSSVTNIYNDQEFCKYVDCDFVKNIQGINRPSSNFDNYELYAIKVISIFSKFLFGNKSAKDTLTEIDNITKIHIFSYKYFSESLIMFILLLIAFSIIILSALVIFIPKYKSYLRFVSKDIMVIYTLGSILLLCPGFTYFGKVKEIKCFIRYLTLSLGFTMVFIPILCNLIINFPEQNKISEFVKKRKFYIILFTTFVSVLFNCLYLIFPFEIKTMDVEDGRNYNTCKYSKIGIIISIIQGIYIVLFQNKNKGEEEKLIGKLLKFNNQQNNFTNNTSIISTGTDNHITTVKSYTGTKATVESRLSYNKILSYHYSTGKFSSSSQKNVY